MELLTGKEAEERKSEIIKAMKPPAGGGAVIIYPTDTIYGIGVNALDDGAVKRLREIKGREFKPFSVIAPSLKWIRENCVTDFKEAKEAMAKLPGPYTIFFDLKNKNCVSPSVNPLDGSLGVRIPKAWFSDFVAAAGIPFVTTSVNLSGEPFMKKLEDLDDKIKNSVDYIIYEGELNGVPSEKIDLRGLTL